MGTISSGIERLDSLIRHLYTGDNVVWEVDAGTAFDVMVRHFIRQSFLDSQKVIYISFNKSPQSIMSEMGGLIDPALFVLVDCFSSGKGKNDKAFLKYYDREPAVPTVRIAEPHNIGLFTSVLTGIEDTLPPGARYVFDSLTGMQDLWGDENSTYSFFTYMCPRLFDLDTVAYWLLERDAHSQKFKANLRHITQVVLELYRRREHLYIKALKLEGRHNRDAFKPHQYEVTGDVVTITPDRRESAADVGSRIREVRTRIGMSQKELADKIDMTPSYVSQLESNQISPALNSFLQIAAALGTNPAALLQDDRRAPEDTWLIRRDSAAQRVHGKDSGCTLYRVLEGDDPAAYLAVIEPGAHLRKHFLGLKRDELIHVTRGRLSVRVGSTERQISEGDTVRLRDEVPDSWKNPGDREAELFVVCR